MEPVPSAGKLAGAKRGKIRESQVTILTLIGWITLHALFGPIREWLSKRKNKAIASYFRQTHTFFFSVLC